MAKICMKCGREFGERSVKCPICRLNLVSIGNANTERTMMEQQRMQQARDAWHARNIRGMQSRGMQDGQAGGTQSRGTQDRKLQSRYPQPQMQNRRDRDRDMQAQVTQGLIHQPSQSNDNTGYRDYERTMHASGTMSTAYFDGRHLDSINSLTVFIDDVKVCSFGGGSTCIANVAPGKHVLKYLVYNDATEQTYWLGPFDCNFEAGVEYDIYPGRKA